ncbi:MAG: DnaB-like helicase C-terminal domain-containing protein [Paludibacteraceae bacterium]|nr:DnaB-like helicase C-terminal domain-containing protein [Paludibacteraceae bacterium]
MTPQTLQNIQLDSNPFIPSYFENLDRTINGFYKSNLTVVGGRPCMGVRSFVLTMACKQVWAGKRVACFFMTLVNNILAQRVSRIYEHYNHSMTERSPLFYCDHRLNIDSLRKEIERLRNENQIDIVYVESVQGIELSNMADNVNHESCAIKLLWQLSRDFNIPVVVTSTLSRAPESREAPYEVGLSDLRGSSSIEAYADTVLLLSRPEYYNVTEELVTGMSLKNSANVYVEKNSNGPKAMIRLKYGNNVFSLFP